MAGPSPEDFAALVADLRAELASASRLERKAVMSGARRPACFTGRPWTETPVLLTAAAELTGYSLWTLKSYASPSVTSPGFPPPVTGSKTRWRRWAVGAIAVWYAARDPASSPLTGKHYRPPPPPHREPACKRPRREATIAFWAALIAADPSIRRDAALAAARDAGLRVPRHSHLRWLDKARAAATPRILSRFASSRPDGLVTTGEIAEVFRVSRKRVAGAAGRGEIRAIRGPHGRYFSDPSRLRFRSCASSVPVPVDKDHPLAVPLPGDREEAAA
jgi:hypothetical protein